MMQSLPNSSASPASLGLSSSEAAQRIADEGYNELPATKQRSTVAIALSITREPMFLLLIVSVSIYLSLGDLREALVLALSLFVILGITIFQERKTERALEALRDLSSPRALVIRDGVNDAPALEAAHIAMGGRGTDVARESAAHAESSFLVGRWRRLRLSRGGNLRAGFAQHFPICPFASRRSGDLLRRCYREFSIHRIAETQARAIR